MVRKLKINKPMKKVMFSLFFVLFASVSIAQNPTSCKDKIIGNYQELNSDKKADFVSFREDYLVEFANGGTEMIKSKIEWTDDCHYTLTLVETNVKNFPVPVGSRIKVEILNVSEDQFELQYLPAGKVPPVTMVRVK